MSTGASPDENPWQPTLSGEGFVATPLRESDFDALFTAASDPGIWAMHPVRDRHRPERFEAYFGAGIRSRGALVFRDAATGEVLGSSRYTRHDPLRRTVEIGSTFLVRARWASGLNTRIKERMLEHAFRHVGCVEFVIGTRNLRSRRAVEKLGALVVRTQIDPHPDGSEFESVVYELSEAAWRQRQGARAPANPRASD